MKSKHDTHAKSEGEGIQSSLLEKRKKLLGATLIGAMVGGFIAFFLFVAIAAYIIQPDSNGLPTRSMDWRFYTHTVPYFLGMLSVLLLFLFKNKLIKSFDDSSTHYPSTLSFILFYVLLGLMSFCFGWLIAESLVLVSSLRQ